MSAARVHYAAEARADWQNLLEMAAQGGRPVALRTVQRLGRRAGLDAAEVARVAAALGCAS